MRHSQFRQNHGIKSDSLSWHRGPVYIATLWSVRSALGQSGLMFANLISGTRLSNSSRDFLGQSGLVPDDLTTVLHLSVSSATNVPKSADEPGNTVVPSSASRAFILLSARAELISLFSMLTIAGIVFLCKPAPNHWLALRPPRLRVGRMKGASTATHPSLTSLPPMA